MSYIKVYLFGIEMLPHHNFFFLGSMKEHELELKNVL